MAAEVGDNPDNPTQEKGLESSIHLPILQVIKEAQQQHGLRHGDFQRYRQYCTRRLRRLRKSLHLPQATSKHKFVKKPVTEENMTEGRFLMIPLMSAERAWSYSMQLKAESNSEPRKRFHMIRKLNKAVAHAKELYALGESQKSDARTKLETQGYLAWIVGTQLFETQEWQKAKDELTKARTIYEKLGNTLAEDLREPYTQRVEDLSPSLRYCAYNIGDASAIQDMQDARLRAGDQELLSAQLDDLLSETRKKQAATLSEVTWRGRKMPVLKESVRVFLLSLKDARSNIDSADNADTKLSIYETLLKDCMDCIITLREELKSDQTFKAAQRGQKIEGRVSNQHFLHTYLSFVRFSISVERSLVLCATLKASLPNAATPVAGKPAKPQDLVRVYDLILQNLSEVKNLTGLEEDEMFSNQVQLFINFFKANRCYYIAQYYSINKKWAECVALCGRLEEHCAQLAKDATPSLLNANPFEFKFSVDDVGQLQKEGETLKYSARASSVLDMSHLADELAQVSLENKKKMLIDRLEEYWEDPSVQKRPNFVSFPPDFKSVPCKPIFFDLASNHVHYPPLESKTQQKAAGLTGFVKGWFWGKK